jgi:DNA-directed RNA polymerase subunit RPC12/RpoP
MSKTTCDDCGIKVFERDVVLIHKRIDEDEIQVKFVCHDCSYNYDEEDLG